jgi:hypothetical protein
LRGPSGARRRERPARLKIAQRENIPLILVKKFLDKVGEEYQVKDQEILFFKPLFGEKQYTYSPTEPSREDLQSPALVIQGFVDLDRCQGNFCKMKWKDTLLQNSVIDIILAGAADHRQYPDEGREVPIHDSEYEKYKEIACKKGFSLDNPITFFINHVYASQVGRLLPLRPSSAVGSI